MCKKTENFIEKAKLVHGNKFDYSKTVYKNCTTKIIFSCAYHGDIEMNHSNHLYMKQGCPKCSQEKHKLLFISDERIEKFKFIHNNLYSYIDLSVSDSKINIICPSHGEFIQNIYNHENGYGCYKCEKESRIKIRKKVCISCKLEKLRSDFLPKYRICIFCQENKIITDYKICIKCSLNKPIDEFPIRKELKDNHRNECKECFNYLRVATRKLYKKKNKDILREKDKIYHKNRLTIDTFYKAKILARSIVRKALRKRGYSKNSKTEEILGCSFIEFKSHIEFLFLDGMNWENRNKWHIDHIIPLDFAINESEILRLNHYSNLRPLWEIDNLNKSNDIIVKTDLYFEILNERIFI